MCSFPQLVAYTANMKKCRISIKRRASAVAQESTTTIEGNMRIQTIFLICAMLAVYFIKQGNAVACSTTVTTDCTNCTLSANASNTDCLTTTTVTATTTVSPSRRRLLRRIAALQNSLSRCRKNVAALKKKIQSQATGVNINPFKEFFG